jgi:hypothetical protein
MTEEKSLKMEGENLAKVAVDSRMGAKQLQALYRLVKTKPLAFVEAFVQRQIGRGVRGYEGFVKALELFKKYEDKKLQLEKVLMYAVMLYDYFEREPYMKLESAANPIVKRAVEGYGCVFDSLDMDFDGRTLTLTVHVRRFHGNPKALASDIEKSLKNREEFSSLNLRVWIESR